MTHRWKAVIGEKEWWHNFESTDHIDYVFKKQKEINAGIQLTFSFLLSQQPTHGMVVQCRKYLPTQLKYL